jgi:tripartite-type tricarboxylate transporter receptor subunit TctC
MLCALAQSREPPCTLSARTVVWEGGAVRCPSIPNRREHPKLHQRWFAMLGPADMPKQAVTTLNCAAPASLNTQEVKDRLFNSGVEVRTSSPQELAAFIESEMQKWAKVVKASGARVD